MEKLSLSSKIEKHLSPEAQDIMRIAARMSEQQGVRLYLAGGAVRDLLLEQAVKDIDLVVEGDTPALVQLLAQETGCEALLHHEFFTAKLHLPSFCIDIASARSESYRHPGALPTVCPADIGTDLKRRDFSINAMAVSLNSEDYGQLLDECGGLQDLKSQTIRVLHAQSFQDDPTRMWRAVRYEMRLGFRMEGTTKDLLQQNLSVLRSISGERLWYELECVLDETKPEKVLSRAAELGLLRCIHAQLSCTSQLDAWFDHARQLSLPKSPTSVLYLALLLYPLEAAENERVVQLLKLNKNLQHTLHDSAEIKASLAVLENATLLPSLVYHTLCGYDTSAIKTNLIASTSNNARRHMRLYLEQLRYIRPILNGDALISLGIKPGPQINAMLTRLMHARLDGKTHSREDEMRLLGLMR